MEASGTKYINGLILCKFCDKNEEKKNRDLFPTRCWFPTLAKITSYTNWSLFPLYRKLRICQCKFQLDISFVVV